MSDIRTRTLEDRICLLEAAVAEHKAERIWLVETVQRLLADDDSVTPRLNEMSDRISGQSGFTAIWGYLAHLEKRIEALEP